jgi:hypothetical protein
MTNDERRRLGIPVFAVRPINIAGTGYSAKCDRFKWELHKHVRMQIQNVQSQLPYFWIYAAHGFSPFVWYFSPGRAKNTRQKIKYHAAAG